MVACDLSAKYVSTFDLPYLQQHARAFTCYQTLDEVMEDLVDAFEENSGDITFKINPKKSTELIFVFKQKIRRKMFDFCFHLEQV